MSTCQQRYGGCTRVLYCYVMHMYVINHIDNNLFNDRWPTRLYRLNDWNDAQIQFTQTKSSSCWISAAPNPGPWCEHFDDMIRSIFMAVDMMYHNSDELVDVAEHSSQLIKARLQESWRDQSHPTYPGIRIDSASDVQYNQITARKNMYSDDKSSIDQWAIVIKEALYKCNMLWTL